MSISKRYSSLSEAMKSCAEVFETNSGAWKLRLTRPVTSQIGIGTKQVQVWIKWREDHSDVTLTLVQYLKDEDGRWFWRQR